MVQYSIRNCIDIIQDIRKRSSLTYSDFVVGHGIVSDNSQLLLNYTSYVRSSLTSVLEGLREMDGVVIDAYKLIEETLDTTKYMETLVRDYSGLSKQNVAAYLLQNTERLLAAENRLKFVDTETQDLAISLLDHLINPNPNGVTKSLDSSDGSEQHIEFYQTSLTPKQLDIVKLIADGCSPTNLIHELCVSYTTVRNHMSAIYRELDGQLETHTTVELARWYLKNQPMVPASRKRSVRIYRG
ncbi:MAG: response regulator transcription factor [Candidatus Aenigmarchaeota archaeon]|nr:response regulator transcription factor [Candidatus Aenigmarchaeota archaeon]